ncbi:hypothetical protein FAZ19_13750 [Sphingobacterium alkalisoli]|uniref:DUF4369 domain-containing protein n=1 Tax=Sphingobacterium alkalisoli TaxID=1874115 RepID=A0A4U0H1W7_9SPHI|nr:hypothetical protein [Sphingobacterium alkalisoli]TJY64272.1 hypothetical protein FAZ19_13750 [Sphingobacterium alkalisoli]GGH22776.1 hypothetical protein GCM10011418_29570 [Sphingobacterium alkalisoli]
MLRYFNHLLLILLVLHSCATGKRYQKYGADTFNEAQTQQLGLGNITEVKFKNIDGSMSTAARMYTDYGKWHDAIKIKGFISTFIWKDVKLLSSSDKLFTVYTSGIETMDDYYSSIMILHEDNTDALATDSPLRKELVELFEGRLRSIKNDEFYRDFWKFDDPKYYRDLYNQKKNRDYHEVLY